MSKSQKSRIDTMARLPTSGASLMTPCPGISAVGEDPLDEREDASRDSQKRSATIAILDARRMRFEHEATPVRVDERMALASVDLLSSIVAAWPASLGDLDALAVDDRGRGAGVAPD